MTSIIKKFLPLTTSLLTLLTIIMLWEYIELPYNNKNTIIGEYYYKKYNPLNDKIKFLCLIIIPSLVYLIGYLKLNKETYSLNLKSKNYFLKGNLKTLDNSLNLYFILFISLVSIEFFMLDFRGFIGNGLVLDTYHEGTYLVPPLNYLNKGGFFTSTQYDYGFFANNLGTIFNYFFGYYTIGSVILLKLILIYIIKLLLILISKKTISYTNFDPFLKKILFIIFTFTVICLPSYNTGTTYFTPRLAVFLLFIYLLGSALCDNNYFKAKLFIAGIFSLISISWWYDIGIYTNILIVISIIYLLLHREIEKLSFLFLGIIFSWFVFFLIMPTEEIKEFFIQFKFISSISDYLLGIEYPKPFSVHSTRWTKALLVIYTTCFMIINLNFSKKYNFNYKVKIFISLLFLSGVVVFNSALTRSDSYHVKYSSGIYTSVFILIFLLFLFNFFEFKLKSKIFYKNLSVTNLSKIVFVFFIFSLVIFAFVSQNKSGGFAQSTKNFINSKKNITKLIKEKDEMYLSTNDISILRYYKEISKDDTCIQVMTSDVSYPYLLKKPSCTRFFIPTHILQGYTENKFIEDLKKSSPNFILYESKNNVFLEKLNMPMALEYIKKNYAFFNNYNGYIFFKKKKIKQ